MMKRYFLGLGTSMLLLQSSMVFAESAAVESEEPRGAETGLSTGAATPDPEEKSLWKRFSLNYTNILFGPSVGNPTSYQPTPDGDADTTRPVYLRNFLSLSYGLSETVALTATAYWHHQLVQGQQLVIQDPFLRVSDSSLINTDWGLNLYSDARVHFGVSNSSREADLLTAFQNFNYLSWSIGQSPWTVALRTSERYNIHGSQGVGSDLELYLAPEVIYQLTSSFAFTVLYEMGASHLYGDKITYYTNDGTDLTPGFSWDITPNLNVNPYLVIYTGGKIDWSSTSLGMFLSWTMF